MPLPVIPKKSLGQNFLNSQRVIKTIVEQTRSCPAPWIVEIGPGLGAITEKLIRTGKRVLAIEKDRELFTILGEKFIIDIQQGNLQLVHDDVIQFPLETVIGREEYQIAANIPYNITGLILRHFLTLNNQPKQMVILIQKEVATRILARDQKHSLLSLSVQAYGTPKLITHVGKGNFNPPPKVDSSVIAVYDISRKNFTSHKHENMFFQLIHAGFAHKRKLALKNIHQELSIPQEILEKLFQEAKLSPTVRAEDICLDTWLFIAEQLI